jgi:hypothetical protein
MKESGNPFQVMIDAIRYDGVVQSTELHFISG